jgi:hypothetical protein
MSIELAKRFHALFMGKESVHGTYNNISHTRETDGKKTGDPVTKRQPVTDELWLAHLQGENGIGIIPIRDDSTCLFGALDIDTYDGLDHAHIAQRLQHLELPLIPCRSKSGGCHIYLFCKEPITAAAMQVRLKDIGARLGYGTCEIFPKQSRTTERDSGSWINMPYFGLDETNRYGVKANGDPYTALEFLYMAEEIKVDAEFFNAKTQAEKRKKASDKPDVLPDGPPCLQNLIEIGFPEGTRNNGLFNLGIYYRKARPNDWDKALDAANQSFLSDPLPSEEVQDSIASLRRKDFAYSCSKQPLAQYCNAVACRGRKYGVGGGAWGFPKLGQLRKLLVQPPVWFLDISNPKTQNTVSVELTTDELQDPHAFQTVCINRLDMFPAMPGKNQWQQTISDLLENVQSIEPPEDSTSDGIFWELLEEFCTGKAKANTQEEILRGVPWTCEKWTPELIGVKDNTPRAGRTYFRVQDLIKFLARRNFREYKVTQISKVLKMRALEEFKDKSYDERPEHWATHGMWNIRGRTVNWWSVPTFTKVKDEFDLPKTLTQDDSSF